MAGNADNGGERRGSRRRMAAWAAAVFVLLLVPWVAMQFSDEVRWGVADFVVAGVLLYVTALTYELVARKAGNVAYRFAAGVALGGALMLVWANLAVGLIGNEGNPANLMFVGVLAVGIIGAIIARFEPQGMARAMIAMALAQALVAGIALFARWGSDGTIWPRDILMLTAFFSALWIGSAWLFWKAARGRAERGAV